MLYRSSHRFASLILPLLSAGLVAGACSSPNSGDTSLESAGGSTARGGSGGSYSSAARGGSSAARGGSSAASSTGGSSAASSGGGSSAASSGGGSSAASSTGGSSATSSGGSSNSTSSGGAGGIPTSACPGVVVDGVGQAGDGAQTCAGVSNEAEPVPVDLFIMMDRSVSMGNPVPGTNMTRWDALHQAMQDFVQSGTGGDDIRAGIGFFGITSGADDTIDCDSTRYSKAVVDIGDLSTVGPDLVAAMGDELPGGLTPAGPALTGALAYASAWAKDHPGRATAVVFVSDGYPTQCSPLSISDIANIAKDAHLNAPYVRTYAIGVGGDVNLDAIALAGGTHQAFKVDEGDISASFVSALHNVSNTKISCEYALPPPIGGQKLDLSEVSVRYTTADDATTEEVPSVAGLASCANSPNGGWYYDNAADPTSIEVCPCTCARFDAGRVDIRVGCKPIVGPR